MVSAASPARLFPAVDLIKLSLFRELSRRHLDPAQHFQKTQIPDQSRFYANGGRRIFLPFFALTALFTRRSGSSWEDLIQQAAHQDRGL